MDGSKKASARAIASARLSSRATCTTGPSPRPASRRTSVASNPSGAPPARITVGPGGVVGEEASAIARLTYAPRPRCQGRASAQRTDGDVGIHAPEGREEDEHDAHHLNVDAVQAQRAGDILVLRPPELSRR